MQYGVDDVLVSKEEIAEICKRLGREISRDYENQKLIMICVLKGAFVFMADLMREITVPCEVDFMAVKSYSGKNSTGVVRIVKDLDMDIAGKNILVIEDIIDSGLTLKHLLKLLKMRNPASIKICAAFDKPDRRQADIHVDYIGKKIPDEFIVGYGLDYNGDFRNLPDVAILPSEFTEE